MNPNDIHKPTNIIQISSTNTEDGKVYLFALCNDGDIYRKVIWPAGMHHQEEVGSWRRVSCKEEMRGY